MYTVIPQLPYSVKRKEEGSVEKKKSGLGLEPGLGFGWVGGWYNEQQRYFSAGVEWEDGAKWKLKEKNQ